MDIPELKHSESKHGKSVTLYNGNPKGFKLNAGKLKLSITYLVPHFRDLLGNFKCYISPDKAPEDQILAVVGCQKWSENWRNHGYNYSNRSMTFVLLAYHWITTINVSAFSSRINWTVTHKGKV